MKEGKKRTSSSKKQTARLRYLIIDGKNLLYRGYFTGNLVNRKGFKISGAFNFFRMTLKLMDQFKPDRVIVCWDVGRCQERVKRYPEYKANRKGKMDPEERKHLLENSKVTKNIISHLPIIQIEKKDIEADDIIGYLTSRLKGTKIVVSNDHDFIQLVKKGTNIHVPKDRKTINRKNVESYLGFPPDKFLLFRALVGDKSDGIRGVDGVGDKTALKILKGEKNIKKEWLPIIDRNIDLMNIGLFLKNPDIKHIEKKYVKERKKNVSYPFVKRHFKNNNFKYFLKDFGKFKSKMSSLEK